AFPPSWLLTQPATWDSRTPELLLDRELRESHGPFLGSPLQAPRRPAGSRDQPFALRLAVPGRLLCLTGCSARGLPCPGRFALPARSWRRRARRGRSLEHRIASNELRITNLERLPRSPSF